MALSESLKGYDDDYVVLRATNGLLAPKKDMFPQLFEAYERLCADQNIKNPPPLVIQDNSQTRDFIVQTASHRGGDFIQRMVSGSAASETIEISHDYLARYGYIPVWDAEQQTYMPPLGDTLPEEITSTLAHELSHHTHSISHNALKYSAGFAGLVGAALFVRQAYGSFVPKITDTVSGAARSVLHGASMLLLPALGFLAGSNLINHIYERVADRDMNNNSNPAGAAKGFEHSQQYREHVEEVQDYGFLGRIVVGLRKFWKEPHLPYESRIKKSEKKAGEENIRAYAQSEQDHLLAVDARLQIEKAAYSADHVAGPELPEGTKIGPDVALIDQVLEDNQQHMSDKAIRSLVDYRRAVELSSAA